MSETEPQGPNGPSFEDQLRDAAYTAVGLGVIAFTLSAPYRKRALEVLNELRKH